MQAINVIAVVGANDAVRHRTALRLAGATRRALIPAAQLEHSGNPVHNAVRLAPWSDQPNGTVIEFPSMVQAADIHAAFSHPAAAVSLDELVCVIDGPTLIASLTDPRFLVSEVDASGQPSDYVARAAIAMGQIERATSLMIVGGESIPNPQLAELAALVSALSPHARLRLDPEDVDFPGCDDEVPARSRPGWMEVLAGTLRPAITDPRVTAFKYEQLRPFRPERLFELLDQRFSTGEFGQLVRSAGHCRIANRQGQILEWDQVGSTIAFHPTRLCDCCALDTPEEDPAPVWLGQELAFIGIDLDPAALARALDRAVLTDDELLAGPRVWARYSDCSAIPSPADPSGFVPPAAG